jgi:hypothetical protein
MRSAVGRYVVKQHSRGYFLFALQDDNDNTNDITEKKLFMLLTSLFRMKYAVCSDGLKDSKSLL